MKQDHDIDPGFRDHLEWQLRTAFRRKARFARPMSSPSWRMARTAALVMMSVTLGAAGTLGAERLQSSSRRELLLARSEIRLEMTVAQLARAQAEAARAEARVDGGIAPVEVAIEARRTVEDARSESVQRKLDHEEVLATGEEPRKNLGAPLIGGRDFVLERLNLALKNKRSRAESAEALLEISTARYSAGMIHSREVELAKLAYADVREDVSDLERRVEIRLAFLEGLIPPFQVDLIVMREAVRSRLRRLERQLLFSKRSREMLEAMERAGQSESLAALGRATDSSADPDFVLGELGLAEIELKLIQDRLGVGAWEPAPRPVPAVPPKPAPPAPATPEKAQKTDRR